MAKLPTQRLLFELTGESFRNEDGSSRQEELRFAEPGEEVFLTREPDNEYDENAVLVLSARGVGIGHLTRHDAALLAPHLDQGREYHAVLRELRGGVPEFPAYGVVIAIAWDGKKVKHFRPLDEIQERFRHALAAEEIAAHPGSARGGAQRDRSILSVVAVLALAVLIVVCFVLATTPG